MWDRSMVSLLLEPAAAPAGWDSYLVSLLVKLAAMASVASVLARSNAFKALLLRENRALKQRLSLAAWLSIVFGASVAVRVLSRPSYHGADLGLEGSLLAGLLGGYITGLVSGIVISLPAMFNQELLTMAFLAGIGVFGGLLRDCAPDPEDIWRFSPFFDLNIYRFFKESANYRRTAFHLALFASILFAEFLRWTSGRFFGSQPLLFYLGRDPRELPEPHWLAQVALYACTLFAVVIPIKIWNSTRYERKLEEQERLLAEARLAALTSQINPHFLFNTLNSISSLIRTNPDQARLMLVRLSKVLRRLLRKHEHFSTLRDELTFIDDYLAIEMVRFGNKLRFEKDVAEDALDLLVPSMLLQPLVENSIKHGLSSKVEGGVVRIQARRAGARLQICVEDDGVGIPEARLATILEHGIGVGNVNERLRVLFGSEYGMWIDSRPDEGTRVRIESPELKAEPAAAVSPT
jgi:two-component system LytT family sensor kinase